jgi:hypothetical protein
MEILRNAGNGRRNRFLSVEQAIEFYIHRNKFNSIYSKVANDVVEYTSCDVWDLGQAKLKTLYYD